jgi:hypothetical protein
MSKSNHSRRDSRPPVAARGRRRRGNGMIAALLMVLATGAALEWMAEHLAVLAGVALLTAGRAVMAGTPSPRGRPGTARSRRCRCWA